MSTQSVIYRCLADREDGWSEEKLRETAKYIADHLAEPAPTEAQIVLRAIRAILDDAHKPRLWDVAAQRWTDR